MTTVDRKPKRGDLDAIAEADTGYYPYAAWDTWLDHADRYRLHELNTGTQRQQPEPGRDCPACPAPRLAHDGWGALATGCTLSIALITPKPGR